MTQTPKRDVARVESLDIGLFDAIPSETSARDKRSLLLAQRAIANRHSAYTYLEIGSHLGGSIQPHCIDDRCRAIYSIDPRPSQQTDERAEGHMAHYADNSTDRMMAMLRAVPGADVSKIKCFELDASELPEGAIADAPHLAFIDGLHTSNAVMSDFRFCRNVIRENGVILFHDFWIVHRAVSRICSGLRREGVRHLALPLEGTVFGIFFDPDLVRGDPALSRLYQNGGRHLGLLFLRHRVKRRLPPGLRKLISATKVRIGAVLGRKQ